MTFKVTNINECITVLSRQKSRLVTGGSSGIGTSLKQLKSMSSTANTRVQSRAKIDSATGVLFYRISSMAARTFLISHHARAIRNPLQKYKSVHLKVYIIPKIRGVRLYHSLLSVSVCKQRITLGRNVHPQLYFCPCQTQQGPKKIQHITGKTNTYSKQQRANSKIWWPSAKKVLRGRGGVWTSLGWKTKINLSDLHYLLVHYICINR